ncbi:hypothetical protein SLE2022_130310 [Rubroshorea leprosula]
MPHLKCDASVLGKNMLTLLNKASPHCVSTPNFLSTLEESSLIQLSGLTHQLTLPPMHVKDVSAASPMPCSIAPSPHAKERLTLDN